MFICEDCGKRTGTHPSAHLKTRCDHCLKIYWRERAQKDRDERREHWRAYWRKGEAKRDRKEYRRKRAKSSGAYRARMEAIRQRRLPMLSERRVVWLRVRVPLPRPRPHRTFIAGFCAYCETPFVTAHPQRIRFCAKVCYKRWYSRQDRLLSREEISNKRLMVFVVDSWRCRLCGEPTEVRQVVPHPRAPTVDHAIPVARGGGEDFGNLLCAHFLCNSRKRDMTLIEWEEHGRARATA